MELKVRQRTPLATAPAAKPMPQPVPVPGANVASAYDILRRVKGKPVLLGRVVPRGQTRTAYLKAGREWQDLGTFPSSHDAFTAVTMGYDKLLASVRVK